MRNSTAALIASASILVFSGCTPSPPAAPTQEVPATPAGGAAAPLGRVQPPSPAPDSVPPAPATTAPAAGLATVLDSANIGRRLDIFERNVGAPTDAGKDWSTYKLQGCTVRVQTEDNVISWISLYVGNEECSVDLEPLLGTSRVVSKATPLTFGEFDTLSAKHTFYTFPCEGLNCGNAFDPYVAVVNPGSHAEGFIDVEATSSMSEDYDSYFAWKEKIEAAAGDDAFDVNLECDRRFDEISRTALASAVVEDVGFGHRKPDLACK